MNLINAIVFQNCPMDQQKFLSNAKNLNNTPQSNRGAGARVSEPGLNRRPD